MDEVVQAERQRLADLRGRIKARKSLTPGQRRDLAELSAKHGQGTSVSCQVQSGPLGPLAIVPVGYGLAAASDEQLAEVTAVTTRSIREWKAEADWPAGQRGPYALRGELPAWIRQRLAGASGASRANQELAAIQQKLVEERAAKLRLERELREGLYVRRADVADDLVSYHKRLGQIIEAADRQHPGVAELLRKDLDLLGRELQGQVSARQSGQGGSNRV